MVISCREDHVDAQTASWVEKNLRELPLQKGHAGIYKFSGGHLLGSNSFFAMPWLPASAQTLAPYAPFLSTEFKAPSSISNYIGGVKTLHILLE